MIWVVELKVFGKSIGNSVMLNVTLVLLGPQVAISATLSIIPSNKILFSTQVASPSVVYTTPSVTCSTLSTLAKVARNKKKERKNKKEKKL